MQHLVDAVRRSVGEKNWYSAIALALALPDIAADLDGREGAGSKAKYVSWYDDYLLPTYSSTPSPYDANQSTRIIMSGSDCYALRCAFLHGGDFDITDQRAKEVLDRFLITNTEIGDGMGHRNIISLRTPTGDKTYLQIEAGWFCEDICVAIEEWLQNRGNVTEVAEAISKLPRMFKFREAIERIRIQGQ